MSTVLHRHGWRLALVIGGLLALAGGPQHPGSDPADPLRVELGTMTADPAWVPAHTFLLASVALITVGLLAARREPQWPAAAKGALQVAGVAMALYTVEAVFHLAAVIDSDRLLAGEWGPTSFIHMALAIVLYPVSGLAIANLARKLLPIWSLPQRPVAAAGIVGGVLHAAALPATLVFSETELSPMFAFGAILMSVFAIGLGLVGVLAWRRTDERRPVGAAVGA